MPPRFVVSSSIFRYPVFIRCYGNVVPLQMKRTITGDRGLIDQTDDRARAETKCFRFHCYGLGACMILACGFIRSTILSLFLLAIPHGQTTRSGESHFFPYYTQAFRACTVCNSRVSYSASLQESLPVVLHRFSNGVEVVKCVVEFCNVSV